MKGAQTKVHFDLSKFLIHVFLFIRYRSGVSLAIRDNNGSFVSTLSMQLYKVRLALAYTIVHRVSHNIL